MAGERTFKITFLGDVRGAVGALNQIDTKLSGVNKVASGVMASGLLQNLGSSFTSQLLGSAEAASALTEATNKSKVVFGEFDSLISAFSADSANTWGISRRAAHEYAGTLGQILRAGGLNQDQAAGMSVELLKLASDMASFNNISIDEALEKIRAGLVGETEPLRTVGVLLSAAAVEQKALEMGITDGTRALTEAEKVQARYALIMEQTTSAQGDFARTQFEAANSSRRMAAEAENAAAVVGGPTNTALGAMRNIWLEIPPIGREVIKVVGMLSAGLIVLAGFLPSIVAGFAMIGTGLAAMGGVVAAIAGGPVLLLIAALAAVVAVGVLVWQNWDFLMAKGEALAGWLMNGPLGSALGWIGDRLGWVADQAGKFPGIPGVDVPNPFGGSNDGFKLPASAYMRSSGGEGEDISGWDAGGSLDGEFATGGVVPGPVGAPFRALVHGGETIIPPGKGMGGVVINVHGSVIGTMAELERMVVAALNDAKQRGGLGFA